jgi:hypothetical protein
MRKKKPKRRKKRQKTIHASPAWTTKIKENLSDFLRV